MDLATYRKSLDMSQEACAKALGLKSKGYICDIENGKPASLRLALKIETWSGGKVKASSLSPIAAELKRESVKAARRSSSGPSEVVR